MSGVRGQIASRPMREIFLTSSSLSFSSLSSSVSWDDAIELNLKQSKASSSEDKSHHQQNGEFSNASSQGTEMSGSTHVRMRPPVPLMDKGVVGNYDPERIPPSVFGKTGDVTWSELSNESLFSLTFDGYRKSNAQAPRQSNIKAEEVLMSPSLLSTPEDTKEKRSEEREIKNGDETRVETQSRIHQEKYYSLSTQDVPLSSIPSNFYCLYAPAKKDQYYSLPVGENKRKKTRKSKIKKKK
ncbi:PREDICTED: uncharacterized protein LOC109130169, partial [Camelina sativa]|uniref:Uncharacterized protein LOC109130169 n=1 Tax=Camelina sativa TaxID=90675 RepID=A0ABM1R7C1_CAMSA